MAATTGALSVTPTAAPGLCAGSILAQAGGRRSICAYLTPLLQCNLTFPHRYLTLPVGVCTGSLCQPGARGFS